MSTFVSLIEADKVPADKGITVRCGTHEIAVFRIDDQFYALDGRCPHRQGPLGDGYVEQGRVYCPLHGWAFEIKNGACIDRPDKPARCLPVRVVDGRIEVQL